MGTKSKATLLVLLLWVSSLVAAAGDGEPLAVEWIRPRIIKGPYLQNVKDDGITVMWETNLFLPSRVDYGVTSYEHSVVDTTATRIHEVRLSGLTPDTLYHYKVASEDAVSADSTFRTATEGPVFSFLVYGDTRTFPENHRAVINAMIANNPGTFVLHTGDIVDDGEEYRNWKREFFDPASDLLRNTTLFTTPGNHEGDQVWYYRFFDMPMENSGTESYYSFRYGDSHFIGLNQYDDFVAGSAQYSWIESDLAAAESSARWIFVFFHQPPYTSGSHAGESRALDTQTHLVPLFEQYGVDLVFSGHDHLYERSLKDCVSYIVAGGGGAPLSIPNQNYNPYQVYAERVHHHVKVDVLEDKVEVAAYRNDLSILDEFEISDICATPTPTATPGDTTPTPTPTPEGWVLLSGTYSSLLGGKDTLLRHFRDRYLKEAPGGEASVRAFYANLPWLAELARRDPIARQLGAAILAPSTLIAEYMVQKGTNSIANGGPLVFHIGPVTK